LTRGDFVDSTTAGVFDLASLIAIAETRENREVNHAVRTCIRTVMVDGIACREINARDDAGDDWRGKRKGRKERM
jgi:phosphatidylglycerophosphate synthase